jgi:GNAT superfamily N-acetyltransferase
MLTLLAADDLRPEGILAPGSHYWGAFDGSSLVGMMGIEIETDCALLRSAVVAPAYRGRGIATSLTQRLFEQARAWGLQTIYLFGTTAGPYWEKRGFQAVTVDEIVQHLPHAPQVVLFDALGWLPDELAFKMELSRV